MIDQVRGRLHHAPRTAIGAEPLPFATECGEMLLKVAIDFQAHEGRQLSSRGLDRFNEPWIVLGHDGVQNRPFGPVSLPIENRPGVNLPNREGKLASN